MRLYEIRRRGAPRSGSFSIQPKTGCEFDVEGRMRGGIPCMVWVTITEVTGDADDGDPSVGQSPGRSVEDVKYNVQIIIDDEESPDGTKVVSTSEECLHPATREAIQTQLDTIVDSNLDDWMPDRWDDGSDDYYIDRDR